MAPFHVIRSYDDLRVIVYPDHCRAIVSFVSTNIDDPADQSELERELKTLVNLDNIRVVIINFANADHLVSPLLETLAFLDKRMKEQNKKLILAINNPKGIEPLQAKGYDQVFDICTSEAVARRFKA